MTSEKRVKNILENMPTKQKIIIGVFIVVVLVIIWQVMGLFGGGETPAPATSIAPAPAAMNTTSPSPSSTVSPTPNMPSSVARTADMQMLQSATHSSAPNMPREEPLPKDQFSNEQEKSEAIYLKKINDLEKLKIDRQIEEMNQAIATARLATATADKSTAELLTKPAPVVTDAAYANQLVNPTRSGTAVVGEEPPTQNQQPPSIPPPQEEVKPDVAYSVISVSFQLSKWSAVIGAQGKLYNVSVGDILPLDGSVIISINKNGVTLKKDKKTRKISLIPAI